MKIRDFIVENKHPWAGLGGATHVHTVCIVDPGGAGGTTVCRLGMLKTVPEKAFGENSATCGYEG